MLESTTVKAKILMIGENLVHSSWNWLYRRGRTRKGSFDEALYPKNEAVEGKKKLRRGN